MVTDEINILPRKLNKKIIKNLEGDGCCDSTTNVKIRSHSEEMMKKWVEEFTNQIDEIDNFYQSTFNELAKEFIDMQAKYLSKVEQAQKEK